MVVLAALVYLTALFAIAHVGENRGRRLMQGPLRPAIYALTLGVYCTSWTFLGSVGLSSRTGYDFLPIYIGPILVIGFASFFVQRIVRLAKENNIASIADFVASRYGKNQFVGATVTMIAVIGVLPYIALQLKAISASIEVFINAGVLAGGSETAPLFGDMALLVALILAFFAIVFGTRQVDTTEHQDGLMIAVAVESAIKLLTFLAGGIFVTWWMFDGPADIFAKAYERADIGAIFGAQPDWSLWFTMTLLSAGAIVMLPRQFHVAVVENRDPADVQRAAWMFPLYLVAINLFVVPIAIAGLLTFPDGGIDRDLTVLALPLKNGAGLVAIVVLIGGLSAATAMVIVECVALAIMISNDLFMPLVLRQRAARPVKDMAGMILIVRRVAIMLVLLLGYAYYRAAGEAALASIGLLAFAAIAQIGPALVGGLYWRRATARGAIAGLLTGIAVWAYALLIPSFGPDNSIFGGVTQDGLFGLAWLRPMALFGIEAKPLVHGVFVSLAANVLAFVGVSLTRRPSAIERLQANLFVSAEAQGTGPAFRFFRSVVTVDELRHTVSRYLGEERTQAAFQSFATSRNAGLDGRLAADPHTMRFAEHLLASAIGASSSRLVLSLMLRRRNLSSNAALRVLDEASAAIQHNRAILQNALDHAQQGVTVFDRELRLLAANQAFRAIFDLPAELVQPGVALESIVAFNAERGFYGATSNEAIIAERVRSFVEDTEPVRLRLPKRGMVVDIRSNHLPDGGRVTTYTDITQSVAAEEALARANETLERRVRERTEELTEANAALGKAKAEAEEANLSKTRFLAAASHDILQPLNAARLYTSSLVERISGKEAAELARNADASLDAVEEIITALLDISRLDSGAMKPEFASVSVNDLFRQLAIEFSPLAKARGLPLTFVPCSLSIRTDRRLMRRLLQNLISNAIKYTPSGRVLVGCRRRRGKLRIEVCDTGIGIPQNRQKQIFREFQRLDQGALIARGLGLGLSIVERIARVLDHRVAVYSLPGKGSIFTIETALAPSVASRQEAAGGALPAASLAGLRVVCIDNEPSILEGMRLLLEGWGCEVVAAGDERAAIAALKRGSGPPDAVIADYHLDRGNGLSAIRAIRKAAKAPVKAILITADRTAELRERAAEIEAQVFGKPLKPAALRAWLSQVGVQRLAAE
jgi:Na+/proline symporter/signal transduction histidine kinase/CheY-like chemotaxis protein